jgi:hypothetical protein
MGLIASLVGYIVVLELMRGEFRRKGEWGWFKRRDFPREYMFTVAGHITFLLLILWAIAWTLFWKARS